MPPDSSRLAAFVHPVSALIVVTLLFWTGGVGLRSRERGGAALRPRHRQMAPWAAYLVWASLALGAASARWLRTDLDPGFTTHGWIGLALSLLLMLSQQSARRFATMAGLRSAHAWIGGGALLLAALQVFFGLPLLAP